ncbi:related to acyl-CoA transferases/carnitine dehydratase [Cephalotrichum gorgonifer]|uniref:Related to acyl-CoA transferases/carnitine dehydratase n=1 Tax=Cephalotrichum gorgonifer TaxID=2041049 RepID=A0AAE8N1G1_9PEZI|nr:related to acyl-CoA transferases/carnitine dehydratase [Cephalotrichum gorgonifer]
MKMMGVEDTDVSPEEAIKIYADKVLQWDSSEIERVANDQYKQAGEPLWSTARLPAPRKAWPQTEDQKGYKPLVGIRTIDFSRVIAGPAVSKILSVLGADVLRVSCDHLPELSATMPDLQTGERDTNLDLKTEDSRRVFSELVKGADILIDGYRPGALKRLGFDSESLRHLNPSLIYMRENCYGFKGPLAHRSGWQQISDCVVGPSYLQGKFLGIQEPVVPLLPNSDYQTGLTGAAAAIQALIARTKEDVTFDIDISLTQYNIWYYRLGLYTDEQQRDLRGRDMEFSPRHSDDMATLVVKTHKSLSKIRPDMFTHPKYFWEMSGQEYGLEENFRVLAPAFKFESSSIGWEVPTGQKGRSKPEWVT